MACKKPPDFIEPSANVISSLYLILMDALRCPAAGAQGWVCCYLFNGKIIYL